MKDLTFSLTRFWKSRFSGVGGGLVEGSNRFIHSDLIEPTFLMSLFLMTREVGSGDGGCERDFLNFEEKRDLSVEKREESCVHWFFWRISDFSFRMLMRVF